MNTVTRGIRNAFRNAIRTFSIVVILGLSVGLALTMLVARQTVQQKINSVKSSIGNTISISPAGSQGFQGGGEPLTTAQLAQVTKVANVTHITETLSDRLTTNDTNLVSAIDPGSLGNRRAGDSGVGFTAPPTNENNNNRPQGNGSTGINGTNQITRTFTPPVIVTGTNDVTTPTIYGGSSVTFTSGQALDPTKDVNEAVVGKALAAKNNLTVGSTFTAYSTTIKVVGIYDSGTTFSNAGLQMALTTLQRLSSQAGDITSAIVTTSSVDTITAATSNIKSILGDKADVTNNQDSAAQAVAPLENVKSISLFSLLGAIAAGAIIILLTMMMIVRERRREIGVMKAIGASNLKTMFQFVSEAVTLTLLGMVVGIVIGVAAANPITKVLVNNSTSNAASTAQTAQNGVGTQGESSITGRRATRGLRGLGSQSVTNVKNIQASVGWSILGYGFGAALVIAIIGSALPAFLISKIRPAEVMRTD